MDSLENIAEPVPAIDKPVDNVSQFEMHSLDEIARQYAEHSVARDARLQNLQKAIESNDEILNDLRADCQEKQMELEKRTDTYTEVVSARNQILELTLQGQSLLNAALKEQSALDTEIKRAKGNLLEYGTWDEYAIDSIISNESALYKEIEQTIKVAEVARQDLVSFEKEKTSQLAMENVCLNYQQHNNNMIEALKKLADENTALSSEQLDLSDLNDEHDRYAILNTEKSRDICEANIKLADLKERLKLWKERNDQKSEELDQVNFELEMHIGCQKELDETISRLLSSKHKTEIEIEELNQKWNHYDSLNSDQLNQLEELLEVGREDLLVVQEKKEKMMAEYTNAKEMILQESEMEKARISRIMEYKSKIGHLKKRKDELVKAIEELSLRTNATNPQQVDGMNHSLRDSKSQLTYLQTERLQLRKRLEMIREEYDEERKVNDEFEKNKKELLDEKTYQVELKAVLVAGVKKIEENIQQLDFIVDKTDLMSLKTPIVAEKMITDLADGMEKWKAKIRSATEKERNRLKEKRLECNRKLQEAQETIDNLKSEVLHLEDALSAKRHSAVALGSEMEKNKSDRDELMKVVKEKQTQLKAGKEIVSHLMLSQDHSGIERRKLYKPSSSETFNFYSQTE